MNRFFTLLLAASCLTAVGQGEISTCSDTLVIGDSQDFDSYLWNTGETGQFLTVTDAGIYTRSNFNVSSTELDFFSFDNYEKIEIAHDEALDFGSDPFTIQLWYRNFGGATSLQSTVIDKYGKSGCTSSQMWMLLIRGTEEQYAGHLIFEGRQNSTTVSLFSNFPVDDGQWHHIVIQRTEVLSLFVDGELQEQSVAGADWIFDNDEVVQIGGGHCGRYTPGNIGPLTIHNTALFGEGAVDYSPEDSSTATLYVSPNSILGEYACTWENAVVDVSPNVVTDSFTEDTETLHSVIEYNVQFLVDGCMDVYACNFDPEAACDDGSCDYTCCPGPGCCDQGLTWNWELSLCQDLNPADINLDGCVQLNDLLDLLSAYGDCGAEESTWQCGDALEYQGYDYETVQIGEQCWFTENCRFLPEVYSSENGSDTIPRAYVLNYDGEDLGVAASLEEYLLGGALYNYPAISFWDLCPADWHVGNDFDWDVLESFASLPDSLADQLGWRGAHAADLKSTQWDGNDSLGFTIIAHGYRDIYPSDTFWGEVGNSAAFWAGEHTRFFQTDFQGVLRGIEEPSYGFSVRCIKD